MPPTARKRDAVGNVETVLSIRRRQWRHRYDLVQTLSKRDVLARYRGSLLGFTWSFISPLFLLAVYTCVFGLLFKSRWAGGKGGVAEFSVMLFCGLIPFNFFNEALSRGAQSIVAVPNFVKRIAFPTDVLPLVTTITALVHAFISMLILVAMRRIFMGPLPATVWLVPVVMLPVVVVAVAASLLCATIGVFIRDTGHVLGLVFSVLLFASPIFYASSMFAGRLQWILFINPIAYGAENLRKVLVWGQIPNWGSWMLLMAVGMAGLQVVSAYFRRVKGRFADVL